MNCADARKKLALLTYGELDPATAAAVGQHLRGCAGCRSEDAAFAEVRRLLDRPPSASAEVDLPLLYRRAAERERRSLRRWRRAAVAGLAAAAVVLVAVLARLEVRLEAHRVVVSWGEGGKPIVPETPPPAAAPADTPPFSAEDLRLLKDLIHALAADVADRDDRQAQALAQLQSQFDALRRQAQQRLASAERDVAALYLAQFGTSEKGEKR